MTKNMLKTQELPKLLTIRQAAEILNVHVETLRRWDKNGKLKAIIVNERGDRRYKPKDLEQIIKGKQL
ncbi:MAG: helix-turn-helix domain-containing protein [Candidatus Bathyarchaeota archaeon]